VALDDLQHVEAVQPDKEITPVAVGGISKMSAREHTP
jgi:hypothetical protein